MRPARHPGEQPGGDLGSLRRARRGRALRRLGLAVFVVLVVLAAAGQFGPRERTVTAGSPTALEASATYPSVVRPGMEIDVRLQVRGASDELSVSVDTAFFEEAGIETILPEPREQRSGDDRTLLVFDALGDSSTTVLFTGRVPTRAPLGRVRGALTVAGTESGQARLPLTMWVLP